MQFSLSLRKIPPRMYLIESTFLLFSNFLNILIKKISSSEESTNNFVGQKKDLTASLQCLLHTSMSVGVVGCILYYTKNSRNVGKYNMLLTNTAMNYYKTECWYECWHY